MQTLGVREGNIIYLKDATGAQLTEVVGNKENHKAQLFNWVKPNKSNVYVYYAGHGAPASKDGSAFLVPAINNINDLAAHMGGFSCLFAKHLQVGAVHVRKKR